MTSDWEYFDIVKQECVSECGKYSRKEIGEGMFERKEIIEWSLRQEKEEKAFDFIVDLMGKYFNKDSKGNVYVPGPGAGGLPRRIMDAFPNLFVLQVDSSPGMVAANRRSSAGYRTEIIEGDILNFAQKENSLDAVIAYGIMRYIPEDERGELVSSWRPLLRKGGVVIVGEGVAKDVVDSVGSEGYRSKIYLERDAQLFRCSLFYLLFNRYNRDDVFRERVDGVALNEGSCYADVLERVAGFVDAKVYVRVFGK